MSNSIVGHTWLFDYDDSAYQITILSESELHWKLVKGAYSGPHEDIDHYYCSELDPNLYFISWVEKSGLGLYNVVNLNTNNLVTHARSGEATYINLGTVTEVKKHVG